MGRGLKFRCYKCGEEYTNEDRKLQPFCECGARRLEVSFGKIPTINNEIKYYVQRIFEEAEKAFGRTKDQLVYEKAFILLALTKFICSQPNADRTSDFECLYMKNRDHIRRIYRETVAEFKEQGFRVPTSAMPGMAEEEMLGARKNELKITNKEYQIVREKLISLTMKECQDLIAYLEIQLKNKLYG